MSQDNANALVLQANTFNFDEKSVEVLNLDILRRTHKENDTFGNPLAGLYHYQAIERVAESCEKFNLNYEIDEIFAAQNKNKKYPGVVILPGIEQKYGPKAIEAHILRRVFTTIQIRNWEDDELTTSIALAFHQDGIQAAIGPNVKICHNQCILSAKHYVTNYGKDKVSTDCLFDTIEGWLSSYETEMNEERERIRKMKKKIVSPQEIYQLIGALTAMRVAHDSTNRQIASLVDTYPLNQSQITVFTEEVLNRLQIKPQLSVWDLYNIATELYKPGKSDIPVIMPQNLAFVETISKYLLN